PEDREKAKPSAAVTFRHTPADSAEMKTPIRDYWFRGDDGLKLHALEAKIPGNLALPAICLPGISRTAEDFRELIEAVAADPRAPRSAFPLDSRGRGLSERDANAANYSVPVELRDLITFMRSLKIEHAIFIGTSRGGILTMALAGILPDMIAGAVLND